MNKPNYKSNGLLKHSFVVLSALSVLSLSQHALAQTDGLPCDLHPGKALVDETPACHGNAEVRVRLMNTDVTLHYHSVASALDKLYESKMADGNVLGKGWKVSVDAQLFFSQDQNEATVVLGDGTAMAYKKDSAANTFWPKDLRETKSYIEISDANIPVRKMLDGTEMFFGYRDIHQVYHLTSQIRTDGKVALQFNRSGLGRIDAIQGSNFRKVTFDYSKTDEINISNALDQRIRLTLDAGQLKVIQFPSPADSAALLETFDYLEGVGPLVSHTDMMGLKTRFSYYPSGALRMIVNPKNLTTSFVYSSDTVKIKSIKGTELQTFENGLLKSILQQESGDLLVLSRDNEGRVVREVRNGLETKYDYSPKVGVDYVSSKFPTKKVTPDGVTAEVEYTGLNKANAAASDPGYQFMLVKSEKKVGPDGSFTSSFAYDSNFRMVEKREGSANYVYSYFDLPSGKKTTLVTRTLLNGSQLNAATYDALGNVTSKTDIMGIQSRITTNDAGLPVSISSSYDSTTMTYDVLNRITKLESEEGSRSFGYGAVGNIETDATTLKSGGTRIENNTLKFGP